MRYVVSIECDNDAFYNPEGNLDPCAEVASILERVCSHVLRAGDMECKSLFDTNGNRVGSARFEE